MLRFRISNPRKGTETSNRLLLLLNQISFRISNPRKGTETGLILPNRHLLGKVSAYLIPARGLKHDKNRYRKALVRSFRISNPRKGTETLKSYKVFVLIISFRISNPRKGTETMTLYQDLREK